MVVVMRARLRLIVVILMLLAGVGAAPAWAQFPDYPQLEVRAVRVDPTWPVGQVNVPLAIQIINHGSENVTLFLGDVRLRIGDVVIGGQDRVFVTVVPGEPNPAVPTTYSTFQCGGNVWLCGRGANVFRGPFDFPLAGPGFHGWYAAAVRGVLTVEAQLGDTAPPPPPPPPPGGGVAPTPPSPWRPVQFIGGVDLTVTDIDIFPKKPKPGQYFRVRAVIRNIGSEALSGRSIYLNYYQDGQLLGRGRASGARIDPGVEAVTDRALLRPGRVMAGRYLGSSIPVTTRGTGRITAVVEVVGDYDPTNNAHTESVRFGLETPGDFDGDGKTDLALYQPQVGLWKIRRSSNDVVSLIPWGDSSYAPVPGDYNGDGITDIASRQWGLWNFGFGVLESPSSYTYVNSDLSLHQSLAVPADYNGDGRTDIATYSPFNGTWMAGIGDSIPQMGNLFDGSGKVIWQRFGAAQASFPLSNPFSNTSLLPVPGDYDGDGKTDMAITDRGVWVTRNGGMDTADGILQRWHMLMEPLVTDVMVPADYDGDGKTDPALFRPIASQNPHCKITTGWCIRRSQEGDLVVPLGQTGDIPAPGDYDGDGRADIALYRPSTGEWIIRDSTTEQVRIVQWGTPGDVPVLRYLFPEAAPAPQIVM